MKFLVFLKNLFKPKTHNLGDHLIGNCSCRNHMTLTKHKLIIGGDRTHELVPMQTDGGGVRLVKPFKLPSFPRDKDLSPIQFSNKLKHHI